MTRAAIEAMGTLLGPEVVAACRRLFEAEQLALAQEVAPLAQDLAYGPHPRHRLDIYAPAGAHGLPVVLFVHGGGFVRGDKGDGGSWANANVGRMAAKAGMVGAAMNYRLAPDGIWPAGSEDIGVALDWLRANVAAHGGSPDRIVLAGTSAGAVHIAGLVRLRPDLPVRGLMLLSGLYGYTPLDAKDECYFGSADLYPDRMPREAVASTELPMFLACAEFDPPRFQAEFLGLLRERLERHGVMPRCHVASGHNHYSMALHLGTSDGRLAGEIVRFVEDVT